MRRLAPTSLQYQILHRVVERLIPALRSACRRSLQKRLLFVNKLIFTTPPLLPVDTLPEADLTTAWTKLCAVTGQAWIDRTALAYEGSPRVGIRFFRSNLFVLRLLYSEVLGPRMADDEIPTLGSTTWMVDLDHSDSDGNGPDNTPPHTSQQHHNNTPQEAAGILTEVEDVITTEEINRRRAALQGIQARACKTSHHFGSSSSATLFDENRRTAFTPEELEHIVDRSVTTQERLVVLLLATTGLRIGGLCRLQIRNPNERSHWGANIPADALSTVEKGNVHRTLALSSAVRILLARWFREDCPQVSGAFVFPAIGRSSSPPCSTSTANMWAIIRKVLERAGIRGPHAHPHTFRHTFVSGVGVCFDASPNSPHPEPTHAQCIGYPSGRHRQGAGTRSGTEEQTPSPPILMLLLRKPRNVCTINYPVRRWWRSASPFQLWVMRAVRTSVSVSVG